MRKKKKKNILSRVESSLNLKRFEFQTLRDYLLLVKVLRELRSTVQRIILRFSDNKNEYNENVAANVYREIRKRLHIYLRRHQSDVFLSRDVQQERKSNPNYYRYYRLSYCSF